MADRHQAASTFFARLAWGMGIGGAAAVLLAVLAGGALLLPLSFAGLMLLALSVLPHRQARERAERSEGLAVLAEEWQEASAVGDEAALAGLLSLLNRLYPSSSISWR